MSIPSHSTNNVKEMRATFQSYSSLPNPDHSREATPKPPSTPDPKQSKSASSAPPNHLIYDSSDGINGVQHPTSEYLSLNLRGPMFSCFDISCASIFFTIFTSFRTPPPLPVSRTQPTFIPVSLPTFFSPFTALVWRPRPEFESVQLPDAALPTSSRSRLCVLRFFFRCASWQPSFRLVHLIVVSAVLGCLSLFHPSKRLRS